MQCCLSVLIMLYFVSVSMIPTSCNVWHIFQGVYGEDDEQNHVDSETQEDEDEEAVRFILRSDQHDQWMLSDNHLQLVYAPVDRKLWVSVWKYMYQRTFHPFTWCNVNHCPHGVSYWVLFCVYRKSPRLQSSSGKNVKCKK